MDVHTHTHAQQRERERTASSRGRIEGGIRQGKERKRERAAFMIQCNLKLPTWIYMDGTGVYIQLDSSEAVYTGVYMYHASLSLYTNTWGRKMYIRFIHNDPWAKSSSGAVYQWKKRAKRKISACVGIFGSMTSKEEPSVRSEKRNNNSAIFKWKE